MQSGTSAPPLLSMCFTGLRDFLDIESDEDALRVRRYLVTATIIVFKYCAFIVVVSFYSK
jgi:hypothetical protein